MAKILCNYFGLSMAAEGKSEFVGRQAAAFLGYVQQDAERCAENCGCAEDLSDAPEKIKREILRNDEELRRREQTAQGVEHDVVAIYDNAGIPSIMHRFRRVTNKELFGGSDAVHPAFIIGGEVYDEIYISVYENTMINGKPYSLPLQEPVTNITMEDFAQACFSKGEGWHCLTAAEWGLLADTSLKLGTLPHGNTNCSHWHGDDKEQGIGEMRLQRVVDCANEISAKYALEKQVRGEERAKATLVAAVWWFMPPFLLPALSAPKTEREAVQLAARREAADTVMKIYVQAMHKALGFGADRVAVVVAETENNFRQFGECTKDGEYYGYAVLARKIGQIIHDTVEVDTSGATEPVFGKTLF